MKHLKGLLHLLFVFHLCSLVVALVEEIDLSYFVNNLVEYVIVRKRISWLFLLTATFSVYVESIEEHSERADGFCEFSIESLNLLPDPFDPCEEINKELVLGFAHC